MTAIVGFVCAIAGEPKAKPARTTAATIYLFMIMLRNRGPWARKLDLNLRPGLR